MQSDIDLKLEMEAATGREYGHAWNTTVEPFFAKKQAELYAAFLDTRTEDQEERLVKIHNQVKALESLKDEFMHFIKTGEMAQITLNLNEENNDD